MKKISLSVLPLILLIGCGSTKINTVTETQTSVETQTVAAPTKTVTRTIHAPAPEKRAPESSTQEFSGNGAKAIGNIIVSTESTLKWTNDGDAFSVKDESYNLFVDSQGHSGETNVPANTYHAVEVLALGNWTIKIVPK